MRVLILFNPISGAGRSSQSAQRLEAALQRHRHTVEVVRTCQEQARAWLDPQLAAMDLLVVVGGDGAMRLAAGSASRTGTPVYHFPCGTENLFAREFGMDQSVETLVRAADRGRTVSIDLGIANGRPFLLMASVGLDAEVVHDLAACRTGSISHLSYVRPVLRQFLRWRPSQLEITVDGKQVDSGEPGFAVVANSLQYGWRINPAARASMSDGQLDVAFFPARSRFDLVRWAAACRLRRQFESNRLVYCTGKSVRIAAVRPCRYQLDGDSPGEGDDVLDGINGPARLPLDVTIQPAAIRVLVP